MPESYEEAVSRIVRTDPRFKPDAYHFLREALDAIMRRIQEDESSGPRHISGKELLDGFREYTLQEFGPMAMTVLNSWGVKRCEDIGDIVFNLVEAGKLGKTDKDSRDDFANGYSFEEAFVKPFEPRGKTIHAPTRGRRKQRPSSRS